MRIELPNVIESEIENNYIKIGKVLYSALQYILLVQNNASYINEGQYESGNVYSFVKWHRNGRLYGVLSDGITVISPNEIITYPYVTNLNLIEKGE